MSITYSRVDESSFDRFSIPEQPISENDVEKSTSHKKDLILAVSAMALGLFLGLAATACCAVSILADMSVVAIPAGALVFGIGLSLYFAGSLCFGFALLILINVKSERSKEDDDSSC